MKKFVVFTQSSQINNFETINSADLISIGTMVNDLHDWEGYAVMTPNRAKTNITDLIPITIEEAKEIEFDMIVTSQFTMNAFGGKKPQSFIEFTEYCQLYPNIPIFKFVLDKKININPIYKRWPELIITNPVFPVITYSTDEYLEKSKGDTITNYQTIIEYDLHIYSPYMMKHHPEIYIDNDVEDNSPDVIYGGIFRPGRKKFFDEYFSDQIEDYTIEVYGTLSRRNYGHIKTGKIPQQKIIAKNSTALATILPPEKGYSTVVQVRVFESFMSNAVTFIHIDNDPLKTLLPNSDYRYFETYSEFVEKLNEIKVNSKLREELLFDQHLFMKNLKIDSDRLADVVKEITNS